MDLREVMLESRTAVERWCEQRARVVGLPGAGGRLLCRVLGGYPMYVSSTDTSLTPRLAFEGYWEMWVTQAIARNAREDWSSVDVGANVGYFTVLLAALTKGNVVAIEPQERLADCLEATIEANAWTHRVRVHECAVGSERRQVRLKVPGFLLGSASIAVGSEGGSEVTMTTLDELCVRSGRSPRVDFMKLDIEGHEPEALLGASELLARDRPTLLVEWCREMLGEYPLRHVEPLVSQGYRLREVADDGQLRDISSEKLLTLPPASLAMLWLSPNI